MPHSTPHSPRIPPRGILGGWGVERKPHSGNDEGPLAGILGERGVVAATSHHSYPSVRYNTEYPYQKDRLRTPLLKGLVVL